MLGVLFFLLIVAVIAIIIAVALYNKLVYLRISRENSMQQITTKLTAQFTYLQQLSDSYQFAEKDRKKLSALLTRRQKAHTLQERITAANTLEQLFDLLQNEQTKMSNQEQGIYKKIAALRDTLQEEKRYFNHLTKERNARLQMFPTNMLAQLI
ncbi:MAG: hypothetical protein Q8O99_01420 [bacterium]|nr:hypothetical protein [bacterium]